MDTAKFDYFVAKYRSTDLDELRELAPQASLLAEEAEAAFRKVAAERGVPIESGEDVERAASPVRPSRPAAAAVAERAYSAAGAELVHIRKVWFLWSLPVAVGAAFLNGYMAQSVKGTFMGPPVALLGLFALVWPLYCVYKLSRAVDPKRSVAWAMVVACFIPIIGWIAPISLVLKAGRIKKAAVAASLAADSNRSRQGDA